MRAVHVIVHGVVQGVGYRAWTRRTARAHGLSGWVRNRQDGTVEAVFAGADEAVAAMLAACGEGPPRARVEGVATTPRQKPVTAGFRVRRTA